MSIAVLTPSRGRRAALIEMLASIAATRRGAVAVYVGLDDDDSSYFGLESIGQWVRVVRGGRAQLAEWTNRLAVMASDDGHEILASFGDDHRPRTIGWDVTVADAMTRMGPGLVYTADGLQDERLPTAPFWHRDLIDAFGFYFPPVLKHLYADNAWLKVATDLGRCSYLPDVMVEHCHPSAGKGVADELNGENDSFYARDGQAYAQWLASDLPGVLERARAVL